MKYQSIFAVVLTMLLLIIIVATAYSQFENIQFHGFISQGYFKTQKNNFILSNSKDGTFEFTETAINFMTSTDKLRIGLQLSARDMGDYENNYFRVDWGFGDYRLQDYLGIRIGRFKAAIGMYNDIRDIDAARIPVLVPQSIYPEKFREHSLAFNGINLYGNIPLGLVGDFDYDMFKGDIDVPDVRSPFLKDMYYESGRQMVMGMASNPRIISATLDGSSNEMLENMFSYGMRLNWNTPLSGLMLSTSFLSIDGRISFTNHVNIVVPTADPNVTLELPEEVEVVNNMDNDIYIFSGEYTWNNLILAAEYLNEITEKGLLIDGKPKTISSTTEQYYGMISYRLFDWLALSSHYGVYYPDKDDKNGAEQVKQGNPDYNAWQKNIAFSSRIDITTNWLVKFEYHLIDGTSQVFSNMNLDGKEKEWSLFMFKTTYSF